MKPISTGNRARSIGHSEFGYNDEELPDDIDDEKYIAIPDKIELDGLARFRSRFPTPRQDPGNRVRTRRAAGGNRIRTASPAHAKGSARRQAHHGIAQSRPVHRRAQYR